VNISESAAGNQFGYRFESRQQSRNNEERRSDQEKDSGPSGAVCDEEIGISSEQVE
jgi:hypothetical protein